VKQIYCITYNFTLFSLPPSLPPYLPQAQYQKHGDSVIKTTAAMARIGEAPPLTLVRPAVKFILFPPLYFHSHTHRHSTKNTAIR